MGTTPGRERPPSRSAVVWWVVLAGAAFVVRIVAWRWLRPATPIGDMQGYLSQAIRLVSGEGYEDTFIPPGYPAMLAVAMRFLGTGLDAACVPNALLGSLTVVFTFLAASALLGPSLAVVAAAVMAFDPTQVLYATQLLSESLAVALVAATLASLAWRSSWTGSVLGGLSLGLGALTRESIVVLLPLLSLALWKERGWRPALAFLVAGFLPIVPWTLRNTAVTGDLILISSRTGYNLLIGNNPYADGTQRGGKRIFQLPDPPVPESLPAAERHRRGTDYALAWITGHPKEFVSKGVVGTLRMFGLERQFLYSLREGYYARHPGRVMKLVLAAGSVGSWILLLPLAVLGMFVGPQWLRGVGLCAFLWLGILGFAAFGEWRFRMPVLPVFVLLAVAGGDAWVRGRVGRRTWMAVAGILVPVLAYWLREVLERAPDIARLSA